MFDRYGLKIVKQEETTAEDLGGAFTSNNPDDLAALVPLGGQAQWREKSIYGLGAWEYSFDVIARNDDGEERSFNVRFEPVPRPMEFLSYRGDEIAVSKDSQGDELTDFAPKGIMALYHLKRIAQGHATQTLSDLREQYRQGRRNEPVDRQALAQTSKG